MWALRPKVVKSCIFSHIDESFDFLTGLTLAEDGTVQAIDDHSAKMVYENGGEISQQDFFLTTQQEQQIQARN